MAQLEQELIVEMQALNVRQLARVKQFVERLKAVPVETTLAFESSRVSEPAFAAIWNNPDDDAYDAL